MRKSIETKIAQIGTFPIDEVWTPITPAINTTTFIARELSALSPIESTSLAGPINSVYGGLYYGGVDTPTTRQLAIKLALMEGAKHTVLTSSGQSAIHLVLANFARPGDHLLICDNITYSSKWLFEFYCATNNIHLEYFAPGDAQSLGTKLREQTKIVFWESPGAFTFELVDGRAIVDHCRNREVITVQDNTWSSSVFHHPLRHGSLSHCCR